MFWDLYDFRMFVKRARSLLPEYTHEVDARVLEKARRAFVDMQRDTQRKRLAADVEIQVSMCQASHYVTAHFSIVRTCHQSIRIDAWCPHLHCPPHLFLRIVSPASSSFTLPRPSFFNPLQRIQHVCRRLIICASHISFSFAQCISIASRGLTSKG